jgi:hypothetical protein
VKRFSQRYLLATLAFLLAAIHASLGVKSALECLIAFTLVYALTGAVQRAGARIEGRRRGASRRPRSRHSTARLTRFEPVLDPHVARRDDDRYPPRGSSRQSARAVYDVDEYDVEDDWAKTASDVW